MQSPEQRVEIMRSLDLCVFQSHPTEDIEKGTKKSGLKQTYTPCVLNRKTLDQAREQIMSLADFRPSDGLRSSFLFLVWLTHARETECKGQCSHGMVTI